MKIKSVILSLLLAAAATANGSELKYIFYFIGDGMGFGHVMSTQAYLRTVAGDQDGLLMTRFPVTSAAMTFSASSPVTDSAAAGTALSTGHKTRNGMLGTAPDTTSVVSMARILKDDGWGVGVCTSVAPDDATPGAFYAHVPARSMYYEIGKDAAASGYDFIAGAGLRGTTDKSGRKTDLLDVLDKSGYSVVRGAEGLKHAKTDKIMLLNTDSVRTWNVGFTIDSFPDVLTLPVITQACLDHLLKNSPDRFFMMVEGGNIDHAAHANDAGGVIKEIINFNEAIQIAYDFYLKHPDETLIVITADHDTGGMAAGNPHLHYDLQLKYIDYQKMSKDNFSDICKAMLRSRRNYTWDEMKEMLTANFGFWKQVPVTEGQEKALYEKFDASFNKRDAADQKTLYNNFNAFAVEVFKVLDTVTGIGWTTTSHTGNMVPVYAVGVDAGRFANLNNNIDIPAKIMSIAGKSLK
jgi:alkaline phosphatase